VRKLKRSICPKCKAAVNMHDVERVMVRVANGSNGQGVYKIFHLACTQE
jgi:hypothetical protein